MYSNIGYNPLMSSQQECFLSSIIICAWSRMSADQPEPVSQDHGQRQGGNETEIK